jgi:membrane protein DedA with SNARE-associated domain
MHMLADGSLVPLPGFLNSLAGPLDHYGYWAIALLLLLENIGVPVIPGELAMIAAAIFAATGRAGLNIVVVGIVAAIATFAGAEVGYLIGRYAGRELILRYGRYVLIKPHHLDRAEATVSRYGGIVVVIARYIVGLREANGIIAGLTQMRWVTFTVYNLVGTCAWVATWVTIGDLAGGHIDAIYKDINRYSIYLLIVLAVLLAGYIVLRVLRHRRNTHEAPANPGAQESPAAQGEPAAQESPEAGEELEVLEELEVREELEAGEEPGIPEELEVPKPRTQST